jgi:SAM-dependent methyltransferase
VKHPRISERLLWNQKYRKGSHASLAPDPFLLRAYEEFVTPLHPEPGIALDVAGGNGRHALWLAKREWRATAIDVSEVAAEQLKQIAVRRNLKIQSVVADLSSPAGRKIFARKQFDLILVFFYLERTLFPALIKALRPGGLLIYKTYTVDQLRFRGGPRHPLHLLKHNELLRAFRSLRVLHYRETVQEKGVAEFVGLRVA